MRRKQRHRASPRRQPHQLWCAVGLAATVAHASPASAGTDSYTGPTGYWSTAGNWSLGHAPAAGDAVTLSNGSNASVLVTFDAAAPSTGSGLASLIVDGPAAGAVSLSLPGGATNTLSVAGAVIVGFDGAGQVAQAGGTVNAFAISLAHDAGAASGAYALSGGALNVTSDFNVGRSGAGAFTMTGGSFNGANFLIGTLPGASGTVAISGGRATANDVWVGGYYGDVGGNGVLAVSGSARLNVPGTLTVYNAADNRFNLNGGTVSAGALDFDGNLARFQWTAGTLNVTGGQGLLIDTGGLNGSYWQVAYPGEALNVSGALTIARSGSASLVQTNGLVTAGALKLGATAGSPGVYALRSGAATFGSATVGGPYASPASGTATITGGAFTVTGALNVAPGGVVDQAGGALALGALIGPAYTGAASVTPAAFTLAGRNQITGAPQTPNLPDLFIGGDHTFVSSGTGAATLGPGGLLAVNSTTVGAGNDATFTQTGGSHTATYVYVGYDSNGVYALSGGSLTTGNLYLGQGYAPNGSGTFNLSGGAHLTAGSSQVAGDTLVGFTGPGVFNNTGGTHDTLNLYLGNQPGSSGLYNLGNGATLNVAQDEIVGEPGRGGAVGTFNQYGGSHTVGHAVQFLDGNYLLADGSLSVTGGLNALTYGANAAFTQNGGLLSVDTGGIADGGTIVAGYLGTASFTQGGGTHRTPMLSLGYSPGTIGTYSLINGSLAVGQMFGVGAIKLSTYGLFAGGQGQFTQYGGTTTIGSEGNPGVAYVSGSGTTSSTLSLFGGTFAVAGGPLNVGSFGPATANLGGNGVLDVGTDLVVGAAQPWGATFMQTGGTNAVGGTLHVYPGASYIQVGGTLAAKAATVDGTLLQTGGTITAGAVTNNGTFVQSGGAANVGVVTGTGSITVNSGAATVASFAQGSVAINGGSLAITMNATAVTNTAGSLSLTGSGRFDLGSSSLVTGTPLSTVQRYVVNGYAGGAWNGAGGIGSTYAAANHSYGVGYGSTGGGQSIAKVALLGDTTLKGSVGFGDYQNLLSNFGKAAGGTWAQGDTNYDGAVGFGDYQTLLSNFGKTSAIGAPQPGGGTASPAASKLTGSASASASTAATAGSVSPTASVQPTYTLSVVTDPSAHTWKAYIDISQGDNAGLATFSIDVLPKPGSADVVTGSEESAPAGTHNGKSAGFNTLLNDGTNGIEIDGSQTVALSGANSPTKDALVYQGLGQTAGGQDGITWTAPVQVADGTYDGTDPNGLMAQVHPGNKIQVLALVNGTSWSGPGNVVEAVTPEPTGLGLLAVGAGGLLARRRRRRAERRMTLMVVGPPASATPPAPEVPTPARTQVRV